MMSRDFLMIEPHEQLPVMIADISDAQLEVAVAEDGGTKQKRATYERAVERLEKAQEKLSDLI